jgi:hypothetical protein
MNNIEAKVKKTQENLGNIQENAFKAQTLQRSRQQQLSVHDQEIEGTMRLMMDTIKKQQQ